MIRTARHSRMTLHAKLTAITATGILHRMCALRHITSVIIIHQPILQRAIPILIANGTMARNSAPIKEKQAASNTGRLTKSRAMKMPCALGMDICATKIRALSARSTTTAIHVIGKVASGTAITAEQIHAWIRTTRTPATSRRIVIGGMTIANQAKDQESLAML